MGRILLTLSFIAVLLWWLQFEFGKAASLRKYWIWLAGALVVQAISGIISLLVDDRIVGNFLYHAIGGGMTTALLFMYVLKTYGIRYNWRVELVILYFAVSGLGVLNELAEYVGELALGNGLFSWDSQDTWRDFVANSLGAFGAWLPYRLYSSLSKKERP